MSLHDRARSLQEAWALWNKQKLAKLQGGNPWDPDQTQPIEIGDELRDAIKDHNDRYRSKYDPMRWLDPVCECGGDKAKTTHTHYCPKYRKEK